MTRTMNEMRREVMVDPGVAAKGKGQLTIETGSWMKRVVIPNRPIVPARIFFHLEDGIRRRWRGPARFLDSFCCPREDN